MVDIVVAGGVGYRVMVVTTSVTEFARLLTLHQGRFKWGSLPALSSRAGQLELLVFFSPLERPIELDRVLVQWDLGIKDLSDAEGQPVFVSPAKLMSASLGINGGVLVCCTYPVHLGEDWSKVKLWWNQNRSFGRNRAFGGKHHLITAQWLDLGVWCNGCCSTREWKVLRGRGLRGRLVGT